MSENKYNNSKIYLIKCRLDNNLIYVGSTIQTLKNRWIQHTSNINNEKSKEYNKLLYIKIREVGIENFYIDLYEIYNCSTKQHLNKKEGEIIKQIGTLNNRIAGRTNRDWQIENNEKEKERLKQSYNKRKDKIHDIYLEHKEQKQIYNKEYRIKNIENIKNQHREYYLKNIDTKKQKQKDYYLKKKLEKEQII